MLSGLSNDKNSFYGLKVGYALKCLWSDVTETNYFATGSFSGIMQWFHFQPKSWSTEQLQTSSALQLYSLRGGLLNVTCSQWFAAEAMHTL